VQLKPHKFCVTQISHKFQPFSQKQLCDQKNAQNTSISEIVTHM
jgi:hypothetical protein